MGQFHAPVTINTARVVRWPHHVGVVPTVVDGFQQRQHIIDLKRMDGGTAAHTQVLCGLGGVGKTQLAAAYADQAFARRQIDLLVWVTAATRHGIVAAYAQAAYAVLDHADPETRKAAAQFLAWLATSDRRWLIVLDDLQTPADLNGLWPPATPTGRVLVTTRRRDAALADGRRRVLDLGVFTADEAVAYLRHKLPHEPVDQLHQLAAGLGHLPLALAQATAYLTDRGLDCAGYRARLTDRRRALAHLLPEPEALPDEHRATVAATWWLSIVAADRLPPRGLARPLLDLAALLDPNGIPVHLFTTSAVTDHLRSLDRGDDAAPVDQDAVADALRNLHRLSLVTHGGSHLRVHALVQRAARDRLTPQQLDTAARIAADALLQIWPVPGRESSTSHQALYANTAALYEHRRQALLVPHGHPVLRRAGRSLGDTGHPADAMGFFADLHTDCLRVLGPDHPHTLATLHDVAEWRGEAGDPAGAVETFRQVLADRSRVLGPDHPDTLTTRNNLAYSQGRAGDPTGAVAAFRQVLTDRSRVLGPDHPDTLTTRNNLAYWRGRAGDPTGAVEALQQVLADRLRVLGPDHRHTLSTSSNLAYWRGRAGDPTGAVEALQQVLADYVRVLGPDHPHTLTTRRNLAYWQAESGDRAGAVAATERVLDDQLRVLGPGHPDALTTRRNLARWRDDGAG
ncbi:NB-ARC domain-containing protein [Micromonospora echinospora]|uniref:NB-ARC domain-containing protein n=3 Tax=Micromonospora echinospora TaxID=1877 RepID=A0A1C4Z575_MICEC|nr:tetratricopeptide repeat protein [Micromonospora echinospora]SCF27731.1 NB-ARC domain-containing protein [Micromonospora echinospora]